MPTKVPPGRHHLSTGLLFGFESMLILPSKGVHVPRIIRLDLQQSYPEGRSPFRDRDDIPTIDPKKRNDDWLQMLPSAKDLSTSIFEIIIQRQIKPKFPLTRQTQTI
jgi:hypothetical protein